MARVLVVEDDRAIRELLQFALECEGYETLTRSDGRDVIALLSEWIEPCVVLMDLMMPWVDGRAVCEAIGDRYPELARHQIVIMSACWLEPNEWPQQARTVLRKPFDLNDMLRLVATLFAVPMADPQVEASAIRMGA